MPLAPVLSPAMLVADLRSGSEWSVALSRDLDRAEQELQAEAEAQGVPLDVIHLSRDIAETAAALSERPSGLTLLVARQVSLTAELEFNREMFPKDRPIVVLTRPEIAAKLLAAPHFATLVKRVDLLDLSPPRLSDDEVERRLSALRNQYGWTDEDLVGRAERHELDGDPDFAEWLILLGRGDLLGA